ncbi:hypothetical protein Bhyg_08843 [Pseudolycoriella hygida]|uniref:Uncharacterized protein n=1 Tax=Pseudolycoriella hygida TaxID=35572 RepID=A0A9Q0N5D1_9DIPT|nr:hypothetical protein Bhyg_08843 [Pseudolycoriella hygida]
MKENIKILLDSGHLPASVQKYLPSQGSLCIPNIVLKSAMPYGSESLNIAHINADGLRPKIDEFRRIVSGVNLHHFKSYMLDKSVELDALFRTREVYQAAAIELNSQQMRYNRYMATLRIMDYTYLYPHDTDNFILIVPRRHKSKIEYDQILKSPLILVWTPLVAIVAVTRFIFNKIRKTDRSIVAIALETFGLSLGMSFSAAISSKAKNLLLWCFCLGTMLSGMLLSSSMFQGFALQLDILTINNLKELEMSGLEVIVPLRSESVEYFFDNIPQKLKLNYVVSYDISDMIESRNTSFAYNRLNIVVQRCVSHGIVKYLVEKNKRFVTGILKPNEETKEMISSNVEPLSISDMRNSFLLGALGLLHVNVELHE